MLRENTFTAGIMSSSIAWASLRRLLPKGILGKAQQGPIPQTLRAHKKFAAVIAKSKPNVAFSSFIILQGAFAFSGEAGMSKITEISKIENAKAKRAQV